jgi:hypothetical protein
MIFTPTLELDKWINTYGAGGVCSLCQKDNGVRQLVWLIYFDWGRSDMKPSIGLPFEPTIQVASH